MPYIYIYIRSTRYHIESQKKWHKSHSAQLTLSSTHERSASSAAECSAVWFRAVSCPSVWCGTLQCGAVLSLSHIPGIIYIRSAKYHLESRKRHTHLSSAHAPAQCSAMRCCVVLCFLFRAYQNACVYAYMQTASGLFSWGMELLAYASRLFAPKLSDHLFRSILPYERA